MKQTIIVVLFLSFALALGCVQELDRPGGDTPGTAEPGVNGGLVLDVRGPANGSVLRTDAVVVHGLTSPGAAIAVNGSDALVDGAGRFQAEVVLSPGDFAINVVATDSGGNSKSEDLSVTYVELPSEPFFLLVTEPEDQSVFTASTSALAGRTAADAVVSVNGVSVLVDDDGTFTTDVLLDEGPNIVEVLATNTDGEILSTIIAVIYRP